MQNKKIFSSLNCYILASKQKSQKWWDSDFAHSSDPKAMRQQEINDKRLIIAVEGLLLLLYHYPQIFFLNGWRTLLRGENRPPVLDNNTYCNNVYHINLGASFSGEITFLLIYFPWKQRMGFILCLSERVCCISPKKIYHSIWLWKYSTS